MSKILEIIKQDFLQHLSKKFSINIIDIEDKINITEPPNPNLGDYSIACFPLAKILKKNPNQIAEEIVKDINKNEYIKEYNISGPYINIIINKSKFIKDVCKTILEEKENYGRNNLGKNINIMIEYSSPNTNKPLHIGHIRNNLIGMSLANILEYSGYNVIKANLINDRGVHICKTMLAYKLWGNNKTPDDVNKKGDHFVGEFYVLFENKLKEEKEKFAKEKKIDLKKFSKENIKKIKNEIKKCKDKKQKQELRKKLQKINEEAEKFEQEFLENSKLYQSALELLKKWENKDEEVIELWKKMNNWVMEGFNETYKILGCKFDKIYWESETYKLGKKYIELGLKKGIFYKKDDGSVWISAETLKNANPQEFKNIDLKDKLLLRKDGTSVYITQDIGTAVKKTEDFNLHKSIYVVAREQILHFKILFTILKLLGFDWADECYHLAYGMVTLPKGMGKIKSREGTAVDADDLIEEMKKRAKEKIVSENLRVPSEKIEQTALDIALAALKVFILQVSIDKDIQFDPNKTIEFTGDTGPAIQYSYARICSIFKKAKEKNIDINSILENIDTIDYNLITSPQEFSLIQKLNEFPIIISLITKNFNISLLVNYLLHLTKMYASIYSSFPVLKAEEKTRNARLILAKVTAQVIKNGLNLLGINTPESM